jgi:hypothetical protein
MENSNSQAKRNYSNAAYSQVNTNLNTTQMKSNPEHDDENNIEDDFF